MDLGFVSCLACASIMACGISGNCWNTGRSSVKWGLLADWALFPDGGAWTEAVPQCGTGSTGTVLWLPSPGVCFWLQFGCLGGSMASAPAQIQRLSSPVHSSTAGREELAVITGSQRWWSEIKISNDVGLIPAACTGQLQPWEAGEQQGSTLVTDK